MTDFPPYVSPVTGQALTRSGHAFVFKDEHYPIEDDIPRFVARGGSYADAFGLQWRSYKRTQLDSRTATTITRDRLLRCLGPARNHIADAHVLECGCGAGRFTEQLLVMRALVTSIDLSDAVDVNRENFPPNERHRVAQADVVGLPFAPRQYDLVLCLGVIQHTPDPDLTIKRLFDQVRPGGWLIIDHYTYDLSWFTKTAPLFRRVLRRMSPERAMRVTRGLVRLLLPLHRRASRSRIVSALVSRLSPVATYYRAHPELNEEQQRERAELDTFDSLTDWHKHFRTRGQVRRTLEKIGVQDIYCERGGNGIEARGRRRES